MEDAEEIVGTEAQRVTLEALSAAYRDIHATLDRRQPTAQQLSATMAALALALRVNGSSGAEALGIG